MNKILLLCFFVIMQAGVGWSATKITDYGFEDWVGYSGYTSPANGYIFSHTATGTWDEHSTSTIVTSGGANCGGNSAYEGTYYHHMQFNATVNDPCLGRTGTSVNVRDYLGLNGAYPTGTKDSTHFGTTLTGPEAVIRFRFRTTGDWTSSQTDVDGVRTIDYGGGLKFVRWAIGQDYVTDDNMCLIKAQNDGDSLTPDIGIYDDGDLSHNWGTHSINWQDGGWHALGVHLEETGTNTYIVSLYLDDWDMTGTPIISKSTTVSNPGNGNFYYIQIGGNWSAIYPINLMGIDLDNVEIWDGMPGADATAPTVTGASVDGTTATITFDETVVTTGYDAGDFNMDCATAGTDLSLTSPAGSGSSRTFTVSASVAYGDTCNLDYVGATDDIEDSSGNDLAVFSDTSVTVNTAQPVADPVFMGSGFIIN